MRVGLVTAKVRAAQRTVGHALAVPSNGNPVLRRTIPALVQLGGMGVQLLEAVQGTLCEDLGCAGTLDDEEPSHHVLQKSHQRQEGQSWFLFAASGEEAVLVHVGGHGAP